MLSATEALEKIFETVSPLPEEEVPLRKALNRVLTRDILARDDLPSFHNSAMDGFAVRAQDVMGATKTTPIVLPVREKVRAGSLSNIALEPHTAIMIMTGAPLPLGADAVVMKEATEVAGNGAVTFTHPTRVGDNIRPQGEDVRKGEVILNKGTQIRPYEIALLAAQGITTVPVNRLAKVAVISTGDELLEASSPLSAGKIRNSNGPAVACAVERWGAEVHQVTMVRDEPMELEEVLRKAMAETDVLLVSGGVSVGEFDYTKDILEKLGVREVFWKVAIKPGKPLYFGVFEGRKFIFGLPGNPISSLVCVEEFVRPALEKLMGVKPRHPGYHLVGTALNDYPLPSDRRQYLFCRAAAKENEFEIHIIRPQGSAMMGMATKSNALALSPTDAKRIKAGDKLPFRWLK